MWQEASMSDVYKPLSSKVVQENSKTLGIQDAHVARSSSEKFVKIFLERKVGDPKSHDSLLEKIRMQTMLLDPPHKHPKPPCQHKPQRLTTREKKRLNLHTIPQEQQCYVKFLPLHELWLGYMGEVLQLKTPTGETRKELNLQQLNMKVMKADYHGSILRVWRSKCPNYVGTEGILIQETQNTLRLIVKENKMKTIPKANSIFTFELHGYRFYLYGNHMKFRASERSVKKFKMKSTIDL